MTEQATIPVIVCGKQPKIFEPLLKAMGPEVEAIHVIQSAEVGTQELPLLLAGKPLPGAPASSYGTHDYSHPATAVFIGGGFTDDEFAAMRTACEGASTVPWIRPDVEKMHAEGLDPRQDPSVYAQAGAERAKKCLTQLIEAGQVGTDAVVYF